MRGVLVVLLWANLSGCLGYSLSPCGDDHKLQIEETRDVDFTCSNMTASGLRWRVVNGSQPDWLLGTCNTCNPANDITLDRPQSGTSVLSVTGGLRRLAGTLECAGLHGNGQFVGSATCRLNIVYTAYNVTCITPVVHTEDWTVGGACHVDKIFSSEGVYGCQWEHLQSSGGTFPGQKTLVPFTDSTGKEYQRMTCSFTTPVPTAEGPHDFVLTVDPRNKPGDTHRSPSIDISTDPEDNDIPVVYIGGGIGGAVALIIIIVVVIVKCKTRSPAQ